jgi:hypothetical protein
MKFWPRTLGMQLIAVTAVAVAVSNLAVATWFEFGNQRQTESALIDRTLDRAASTASLLSVLPSNSREAAAETLSSGVWSFSLHKGPFHADTPMDGHEANMAARLRALLPPATAKLPVSVDVREPETPTSRNPRATSDKQSSSLFR